MVEMPLMLTGIEPTFVMVTPCEGLVVPTSWLPKVSEVGETLTVGATPVPLRPTVCGLPAALSLMLSVALRVPVAVGVKVTLIEQLPPVATDVPQLLVWAKSPGLAPVREMPLILSAPLPVLLRVTVWAELGVRRA